MCLSPCHSVSIVNFQHVIAGCENSKRIFSVDFKLTRKIQTDIVVVILVSFLMTYFDQLFPFQPSENRDFLMFLGI